MPALLTVPFPTDIPTHPLLVIDYELLKSGDVQETDKLWTAATELGFWYLKNHGADELVDGMFDMGAETAALPLEEKMKYYSGDNGGSHGYKKAGSNAVDENGTPDNVEFINIAKDDALAWPERVSASYPPTVEARMKSTIIPFAHKSMEVNYLILDIFNERLGLSEGTLRKLHSMEEYSGSEARAIRSPARPDITPEQVALGAHTDFGSLSFLHNRLGGLQVLTPGADKWQFILPIPGYAVCNIGDALTILSGGILRSNMHRVIPPPGEQAKLDRSSVVFFTRPGNSVVLRALVEDSEIIANAIANVPDKNIYEAGSTAKDWFARRIKYQRLKNYKGPETWRNSRGTEHRPYVN